MGTSGQQGGWSDAGSSLGYACLCRMGSGTDGTPCLTTDWEDLVCRSLLPGPWHGGSTWIIPGTQAAVQQEEPCMALETAARQSRAVSALKMLCHLWEAAAQEECNVRGWRADPELAQPCL